MKRYIHNLTTALVVALLFAFSMQDVALAENGTDNVNYYKGVLYNSEEQVRELEEILKADGFTCITGNKELYDTLATDTWFPYYYYTWQPEDTCHIYTKMDVMNDFLANRSEEKGVELGNNTYVCDYSWFTKVVAAEDVPTEVGSLGISCRLDKDLDEMIGTMSELDAPAAMVVVTNQTTGTDYTYNLTKINNYQDIRNVPIGVYTVKSAYIMGGYTGVWSEKYDTGYSLQPNGSSVFFINFENNRNIDGSVANLGYEELQFRKIGVNTPNIVINDRSKERNKSTMRIISVSLAVIALAAVLLFLKKMGSNNDNYD